MDVVEEEGRERCDPGKKEQYHALTRCWRRVTIRWRKTSYAQLYSIVYGKKNRKKPISRVNACSRLTFSTQATILTPMTINPLSNPNAWNARTLAVRPHKHWRDASACSKLDGGLCGDHASVGVADEPAMGATAYLARAASEYLP